VALSEKLDLYLKLERIMMDLDDRGDPLGDRVRDLMDPIWYSLNEEDLGFLDSRGVIEVRALYPVTLPVPDLFLVPESNDSLSVEVVPEDGIGKRFSLEGVILSAA